MKKLIPYLIAAVLSLLSASWAGAQDNRQFLNYKIVDGDTVFVSSIKPSYSFGKGRGRSWRKYYRLVHNFSKTYPYALEARRTMDRADKTIAEENLRRRKKDRYINSIQKDILDKYEPVIRNMTVSQGKLLIKLIGRETGFTPYEIIHDYKNRIAAGFWQGVAKFFGGDLKKEYDPKGEDVATEGLVEIWEAGEFPELYFSIFGKYPNIPEIPS